MGFFEDSALVKVLLDWLVSVFVLFYIFGSRFNHWPETEAAALSGSPRDYISRFRYYCFCLVYMATYAVAALVLKNFPQLLALLPDSVLEPLGLVSTADSANASTMGSMLAFYFPYVLICAIAVTNWKPIRGHDERWRAILHDWARIPRDVEELILSVSTYTSFFPVAGFKPQLEAKLVTQNGTQLGGQTLHQFWLSQYDEMESLRSDNSVNWLYLKAVCLAILVRNVCSELRLKDIGNQEDRLQELGAILPFKAADAPEVKAYSAELESMSAYFVEGLCKHLVRKYSDREDQFSALRNMGFKVDRVDIVDPKIKEAVVWCLIAVFAISCSYVSSLLYVIDQVRPVDYFTFARFVQWESASFVCFSIAILVGFFMKSVPKGTGTSSVLLYFSTLLVSMLGSYIYFRIAQDLGQSSMGKPWARIALSLSFASLSLVVLSALQRVSHDVRDVVQFSMIQGVVLGVIMLLLQIAISLSFRWDVYAPLTLGEWLSGSNGYLLKVGFVGFWKGFFLAFVVSFAIQEVYRRQLLSTLRKNPRAEMNLLVTMNLQSRDYIASTKDISKYGLKLQTRHRLQPNQVIPLTSRALGEFDAVVRWSKRTWMGGFTVGLEITEDIPMLQSYLRSQYGEFYA